VVDIQAVDEKNETEMLRQAASVESGSSHPLAVAVVNKAHDLDIKLSQAKNLKEFPGFGLSAEIDGRSVIVGNAEALEREKIDIGILSEKAGDEMDAGRTIIYVAVSGQLLGMMSLADKIREEAAQVLNELERSGRRVVILTGDNYQTARGVATELGIGRFEAGIKPDQKATVVETYRRAGHKTMMVGDGINDAPALAAADIGVALGCGTDVAIEAADIILIRDDLTTLLEAYKMSEITFKTIKQNLFWAFFYNIIAIPLAAGLLYPILGIGLSPIIAAGAMAFSSLFVVTNSLRLLKRD
jgi:Cu+-exporting ATPase